MFVRMRVFMRLVLGRSQRLRGHGLHQMSMLDALQCDEFAGKVFYWCGLSVHNEYFQAGVVVQVRMACGDDKIMMLVL